ncbi:MAG: magnesium transporter [Chlamydiia bacterium]
MDEQVTHESQAALLELDTAHTPETENSSTHVDELLIAKLEQAFHKPTSKVRLHDIAKIASEHVAVDLAYAACRLPQSARVVIYQNLPDLDARIEFITETDSNTRSAVLRSLTDVEIKQLIDRMPADEAVWVLEDVADRRYRRILDLVDSKKSQRIRALRQHAAHSAGRLMTNEFFAFTMDITIGEAAATIRDNPGIDFTKNIFVLNHAGELQGYVPSRNLIVNPAGTPLRQVMRPVLHKVKPDTSRDDVVDLVERYKISALPVVDVDDYLVGVITYDDVVEALQDITDERLGRMAGTVERLGGHESLIHRFAARAPWLMITLLAGLVNMTLISGYTRGQGSWLAFILFFVPLITGMSGNVGIQSSTVLVRSMALGLLHGGRLSRGAILREFVVGSMIGFVFGCGTALIVACLGPWIPELAIAGALKVGIIVGAGLMGACLTGSMMGICFPLFFHRLGVDPALAAGPLVTAFNDTLSMVIYFVIAAVVGVWLL